MREPVHRLLLAAALAGLASPARAEEPYRVYPVTTALHKEFAPASVGVMALVDATDAVKGDGVTLEPLKLKEFRKAIQGHKKGDAGLHLTIFFPGTTGRGERAELLRYALIGLGHESGFAKVSAVQVATNDERTWGDYLAPAAGKPRQPAGDEAAAADKLVKAYPVRTELSRLLTNDSDCAVVIVPPLAGGQGAVPADVKASAGALVGELKLPNKKRVTLVTGHVPPEEKDALTPDLFKLAKTLGFEEGWAMYR